jgi:SOS-response transcriptional repressor LexA
MPAITTILAECRVFEALGEPCGIVVADPESNQAAFRFRRDWDAFDPDEAEILEAICADLPDKAREMGVSAFLNWIDNDLSNTFRCGDPSRTLAVELERTAQTIFSRTVRTTERRYQTHLPVRCAAAAGPLLDNPESDHEEWVDVDGVRMSESHFLVRVVGHSMEPEIPDGSLCLFRRYAAGSRTGKIMLIHELPEEGGMGRFSIKRYESRKRETREGWEHERISMHSENPEFAEWDLSDERRYQTTAEFVRVVADPELPLS